MLDNTTRKRIDDCRDILVGKLPDPKSQIEQITIALIYKFMDDMDKESIDLGGTAKFFSADFEKYSWDNLFDAKVTAVEMLNLYSEAIESMEKNPNIPQLFRDIFKNAYLPYRDPETLKLFLKTIGEFEYTHSEKLGDAFEYLLSVMGSQGDAGQFRTPRHIIDFLVEAVDPSKTDTILDPACGTAGFLISTFKRIKEKNNNQLTPDQRKKLIKNFIGYDISPDMVRLSLVNLYLHGFSDPHIFEYDTLTNEDRWNDNFDVVLANPPFMSPKGGIRPHKKFTVTSNRSEVLFVDYIAEHLNPKGRAGIIVPEGVIFQNGKAYKQLRKMLVDDYLYAVVSLPAGVFNPYSGVKTSILLMDKSIAKKSNEVLFVKIDNDGYNLGAQRNEIKGGQLGEAIEVLNEYKKSIENTTEFENTEFAHAVAKSKIAENGEFKLSGETYKEEEILNSDWQIFKLGEICDFSQGIQVDKPLQSKFPQNGYEKFLRIENYTQLSDDFRYIPKELSKDKYVSEDDVVVVRYGASAGFIGKGFKGVLANNLFKVSPATNELLKPFLYHCLNSEIAQSYFKKSTVGGAMPALSFGIVKEFQIPLPPISIQEDVATEIEGYQKIIDGAKMVVENYKPQIEIDPNWEMVELQTISNIISGYGFSSTDFKEDNPIKCIKITNVGVKEFVDDDSSRLPEKYLHEYSKYAVNTDDLVISLTRTIISSGLKVTKIPVSWDNTLVNQRVAGIKSNGKSNIDFIYYYLCSEKVYKYVEEKSRSLMQPNLSVTDLKKLPIPFPSIEEQNNIVSQLNIEQSIMNSNNNLIDIFEKKIKDTIAKVWGV